MIKAFYENGNGNVGAREEADFIEFVLDTLNTLYMKNYRIIRKWLFVL
jgi:hypothetical protein